MKGPGVNPLMWRRLVAPPAIVAGSLVVLLSAVILGVSISGLRLFPPFGGRTQLGRSLDWTGIAPLTDRYVDQVLGPGAVSPGSLLDRVDSLSRRTPSSLRSLRPRIVTEHPFTNDNFEDAKEIPSLPYTAKTKSNAASWQQGEPTGCASAGGTVWYRYVPIENGPLIANTLGTLYATAVGVFTGTRLGDLKLVGCDTDVRGNSQAGFSARAGRVYFFQVTGPAGGGDLILTVEPLGVTSPVSLSNSSERANEASSTPSISADGRFVAFVSWATNLVPGLRQTPCTSAEGNHNNLGYDHQLTACPLVFVRDRLTRTTRLVSVSTSGFQANDASGAPSISADGRYVAFHSLATNLVADTNNANDIFVHDLVTRVTTRVSVSSSRGQASSDRSFLLHYQTGSMKPSISSDGRYVAFQSDANNLVPGDINDGHDVFVHDRVTRQTKRVAVAPFDPESPSQAEWYGNSPDISGDGRYVTFQAGYAPLGIPDEIDAPPMWEIFVQDLHSGATSRVSVSSSGERGNDESGLPRLSDDGRFVVFSSLASNLIANDANATWDLYVRDLVARTTTRVSVPDSGSWILQGSISSDGRYVAYDSDANELDPGETSGRLQMFLHDLVTHTTTLISMSATGEQANNGSTEASISADGKLVAFQSDASNLVHGDTNGVTDIFVYERP